VNNPCLAPYDARIGSDGPDKIYLEIERRIADAGGKGGENRAASSCVKESPRDSSLNCAERVVVAFRRKKVKHYSAFIYLYKGEIEKDVNGRLSDRAIPNSSQIVEAA
jgi:hypothetical protein